MERFHWTELVIALTLMCGTCLINSSAVLTFLLLPKLDYTKTMYLSEEHFTELRECLCNKRMRTCTIYYSYNTANTNFLFSKDVIAGLSVTGSSIFSDYFKCTKVTSVFKVKCEKQYHKDIKTCDFNTTTSTALKRNVSVLSCDQNCVGIIWSSDKESLNHSQVRNKKEENCGRKCKREIRSTPSTYITTLQATVQTPTSASINTHTANRSGNGSNMTSIIIGVVVSVVLVVFLAVIALIFWRRMKQRPASPKPGLYINDTVGNPCTSTGGKVQDNARNNNGRKLVTASSSDPENNDLPSESEYTYIDHRNTSNKASIRIPQNVDTFKSCSDKVNDIPDDGYAVIDQRRSNRHHAYANLGDKERNVKNPYDVLSHATLDAKQGCPIQIPSHDTQPGNQQPSPYTMAQPILQCSASPQTKVDN